MLLIKHELDGWAPGEHSGTFRGNNLALVAETAAIDIYWRKELFADQVKCTGTFLHRQLSAIAAKYGNRFAVRGRGMVFGFDCFAAQIADTITRKAFEKGLTIERRGPNDQVIKFLPALMIDRATLNEGLAIFEESVAESLRRSPS